MQNVLHVLNNHNEITIIAFQISISDTRKLKAERFQVMLSELRTESGVKKAEKTCPLGVLPIEKPPRECIFWSD